MDKCDYCGHDLDEHDENDVCQAWTNLGGDPPALKKCACQPMMRIPSS